MKFPHEKLPGIDRDRLIAVVEPILRAHGVTGVELLWQTQQGEQVLRLTVEQPGLGADAGAGVTLEQCSDVSRDLSSALDVAEDVLPGRYRLEVGTPGLERGLFELGDYERFRGKLARVRVVGEDGGRAEVFRARVGGLGDAGAVRFELPGGESRDVLFERIASARLVFEWGSKGPGNQRASARDRPKDAAKGKARPTATGRTRARGETGVESAGPSALGVNGKAPTDR